MAWNIPHQPLVPTKILLQKNEKQQPELRAVDPESTGAKTRPSPTRTPPPPTSPASAGRQRLMTASTWTTTVPVIVPPPNNPRPLVAIEQRSDDPAASCPASPSPTASPHASRRLCLTTNRCTLTSPKMRSIDCWQARTMTETMVMTMHRLLPVKTSHANIAAVPPDDRSTRLRLNVDDVSAGPATAWFPA